MTDAYQQPRAAAAVPDKPVLDGLEAVWSVRWEADQVCRFDRSRPRSEVYAIDTPPPTVSGSLHVGDVFSYTHTDIYARYQRMNGKAVFYPLRSDDQAGAPRGRPPRGGGGTSAASAVTRRRRTPRASRRRRNRASPRCRSPGATS